MRLKKELLDNQTHFSREVFARLISYNRQEINTFTLNYLTEHDKERWESLVKSFGSVLRYKPSLLTNGSYVGYFDSFDSLLTCVMGHLKKRYAAKSQENHEILFKGDLNFSRSLGERICLMLSENASNCGKIRIPEPDREF